MDNLTLSAALDMSYRPHCDWLQIEISQSATKKQEENQTKNQPLLSVGFLSTKFFLSYM